MKAGYTSERLGRDTLERVRTVNRYAARAAGHGQSGAARRIMARLWEQWRVLMKHITDAEMTRVIAALSNNARALLAAELPDATLGAEPAR